MSRQDTLPIDPVKVNPACSDLDSGTQNCHSSDHVLVGQLDKGGRRK